MAQEPGEGFVWGKSGLILKLGRVFREIRSQDRAKKTPQKVIRDWAEGVSGPETLVLSHYWPSATLNHFCPPCRPGTLAPLCTSAGACAGLGSADGIAAFCDRRPWAASLHPPNPSEHTSEGIHSPCTPLPCHPLCLLKLHPRDWQSWVSPSQAPGRPLCRMEEVGLCQGTSHQHPVLTLTPECYWDYLLGEVLAVFEGGQGKGRQ